MDAPPRVVWLPGDVRTEIHLHSADTAGAFCLLVDHPPAGWALPLHLHRGVAETIHIVEGEFDMEVAGRRVRLHAGETLHVPADTLHAGANAGDATGRRVLIFSPAGMERFFLEAGASSQRAAVDPQAVLSAAKRNGWEFAAGGDQAESQMLAR